MLPKTIYRFNTTNGIFHRTRTNSPKFIWNHKRPLIATAIRQEKAIKGGKWKGGNWKGGNETITVCRRHDSVHGKPYRLHSKNYLT